MTDHTSSPTPSRSILASLSSASVALVTLIVLLTSNLVLAFVVSGLVGHRGANTSSESASDYRQSARHDDTGSCNVRGISLHGDLYTYLPPQSKDDTGGIDATASEDVIAAVRDANADDSVKAILVDIDSPGGGPVAGEEMANAFRDSAKPVVAVIREQGASAAYWAATGADTIFASASSDVGSIGVTSSYVENSVQDERNGLRYVELSSGKFKDTGSPDKPLSQAERDLILRDIRIVHDQFVSAVAKNRNIPVEQVRALADGSSMTGSAAVEKKLIDQIGSFPEAEKYLAEKIGEDADVCW